MSEQLSGQASFYSVDVDNSPDLAQKFGVMSIPTMVLIKKGEEVDRLNGAVPEAAVKDFASQ